MKFVIYVSILALFIGGLKTNAQSSSCHCGQKQQLTLSSKIIGGNSASLNEWPWMAVVAKGPPYVLVCGGSIINDLYILTSAQCVQNLEAEDLVIVLGDHDVTTTAEANARGILVSEIIIHNDYVNTSVFNDIALLRLRNRITFSDTIKPVCLPESSVPTYAGETAIITGWGATVFQGGLSPVLQEASLTVLSQSDCANIWIDLDPKMLCAAAGGKSSCHGDGGGPLVFKDTDGFYDQIGIISFGYQCNSFPPGVFTRVNKYLGWINSRISDGNSC